MWCGPRLRPNFCKMARGPKSLATPELIDQRIVRTNRQLQTRLIIFDGTRRQICTREPTVRKKRS